MLRMTENHVLPELNKVVMFPSVLNIALPEISFAAPLGILTPLLVSKMSGCRR